MEEEQRQHINNGTFPWDEGEKSYAEMKRVFYHAIPPPLQKTRKVNESVIFSLKTKIFSLHPGRHGLSRSKRFAAFVATVFLVEQQYKHDNEEHVSIVISIEKRRGREGGCPHFLALEGHDQACEAIHTKFTSNDIKVENKSREAPNDARFKHLMETRVAFL